MRAAAFAIAGMAAMALAFVYEIHGDGLELGKALLDFGGEIHRSSCTYLASTSDCAITKRNMSPMPPKSLKVAQIFSE